MITEEELRISNLSYTNKDFASIYPELLDLAKRISPKWDPSQTNESDPGLVLLKLLAFVGDKINYNSDKNVLECFLPSATQDKSVRSLCEINGYSPKYYQSATTTISFRYDGKKLAENDSFTLDAFDTVISDESGEVSYSLLSPVTFYERKTVYSALAMQGTFERLRIGNKDLVQLTDLDDSNRVYLPETQIAQNGVFVFSNEPNGATSYLQSWERVDNLNLVTPSNDSYVYKVGYDSEQASAYIEFPNNISDLIEDGIAVLYCKTQGSAGNVSANVLTTLVSPLTKNTTGGVSLDFSSTSADSLEDDSTSDYGSLVIKNLASTINGADPEGIDDAYNNFKKTVGTFNTLVTCKDYSNAIYNMTDEQGNPYVSNVAVSDVRTDVNYGTSIVTYSEYGKITTRVVDAKTSPASVITPYDLCMYPLQPMRESYTANNYVASFTPLSDTVMIKQGLDDPDGEFIKTLSHNYKELADSDIWAIKNYYGLNATLTTTYKVNEFEQAEIRSAVITALMKAFNGRKVDYGCEIPFDSILKAIEGADSRIKNVSLEEPKLTSYVMTKDMNETPLMKSDDLGIRSEYLKVLAKNILAGRIPLFDYDEDFQYDFGMSNLSGKTACKIKGIYEMDTETVIKKDTEGNIPGYASGYTLRENEVIQFIAPNMSSKITYPAYTNFEFSRSNPGSPCGIKKSIISAVTDFDSRQSAADELQWYYVRTGKTASTPYGKLVDKDKNIYKKATSNNPSATNPLYLMYSVGSLNLGIQANEEHVMEPGEKLTMNYTDSSKKEHTIVFSSTGITDNGEAVDMGTQKKVIVRPNFDVYPVTSYAVSGRSVITKKVNGVEISFYTLSTNETIEDRRLVETEITDPQLNCYWSTSSPNNALFTKDNAVTDADGVVQYYERLLGDSEYFAYTDSSKTELAILQSGTKIRYNYSGDNIGDWTCEKELLSDLTKDGFSVFSDFNWKVKAFNKHSLTVVDMQILTLTEGDKLQITEYDKNISSAWEGLPISAKVSYTLEGETPTSLNQASSDDLAWQVRSRLDLNCGPKKKQLLQTNQSVKLYYVKDGEKTSNRDSLLQDKAGELFEIAGGDKVYLMTSLSYSGVSGGHIDTVVSNISAEGIEYSLDLNALAFEYEEPTYKLASDESKGLTRMNGYATIPLSELKYTVNNNTNSFSSDAINLPMIKEHSLLMVFPNYKDLGAGVSFSAYDADGQLVAGIRAYNSNSEYQTSIDIKREHKPCIFEISGSVSRLSVIIQGDDYSKLSSSATLVLGALTPILARTSDQGELNLKKALGLTFYEEASLLETLRSLDSESLFYYNAPLDYASQMDVDDMSSPYALWDKNNVYNRVTIGEVDLDKESLSINIAKSSRSSQ